MAEHPADERQLVEWHIQDLRLRNLREGTLYQRRRVLTRLRASMGGRPLLEATYRDLATFLARPIAPESRAVETTHVRQFYEWALDSELLDVSPAARLRRPKVPRRRPNPIGEEDLEMAIALARPRIRPWLLLAAYAGLRACEVAPLRADDIIWNDRVPHIVIREGKGGHAGAVAMPTYLSDQLRRCDLPLHGWLFPRQDDTPGHTPAHLVSRLSNAHLADLGIDRTFHKLRHRYGTQVLRASGGNVRIAQEALRHLHPLHPGVHAGRDERDPRGRRADPHPRNPAAICRLSWAVVATTAVPFPIGGQAGGSTAGSRGPRPAPRGRT